MQTSVSAREAPSWISWMGVVSLLVAIGLVYRGLFGFAPEMAVGPNEHAGEAWFFSRAGASLELIYGLTLLFLARRIRPLTAAAEQATKSHWTWVLGLLAGGLALWAYYLTRFDLLIPSLSLLLLAVGGAWAGGRGIRILLFPAVFLLLAMPLPAVWINPLVYSMQLVTAQISQLLLSLLGIPSVVSGEFVQTSTQRFQVIETCSGLRMMDTLIMAALVFGEAFWRRWSHTLLLVAAAPLVAFGGNQLRVLILMLTPNSDFAAIHFAQGIVVLIFGVLLLAAFDALICKLAPDWSADGSDLGIPALGAQSPSSHLPAQGRIWVCAIAIALIGLGTWVVPRAYMPREPDPFVGTLLKPMPDWSLAGAALDRDALESTRFSRLSYRRYERGDDTVKVLAGEDSRLNVQESAYSPRTERLEPGWNEVGRDAESLPGLTDEAQWVELRRGREHILVLHWRQGVSSLWKEFLIAWAGLDQTPLFSRGRSLTYRLATPVERSANGYQQARDLLRGFALELIPRSEK